MTEVTRRVFLGTVMALPVAAVVPAVFAEQADRVVPLAVKFYGGKIVDVTFWMEKPWMLAARAVTYGLMRADGPNAYGPILSCPTDARSMYRWVAMPSRGIVVTRSNPVYVHYPEGARCFMTVIDRLGKYFVINELGEEPIPLDPEDSWEGAQA